MIVSQRAGESKNPANRQAVMAAIDVGLASFVNNHRLGVQTKSMVRPPRPPLRPAPDDP
jgi:hypothetical protein